MAALSKGLDGVLVARRHPGGGHCSEGAKFADTVEQVKEQIKRLGPARPRGSFQPTEPGER